MMFSSPNVSKLVANLVPAVGTLGSASIDLLPAILETDYLQFVSSTNGGYSSNSVFHFFGPMGPPAHDIIDWNEVRHWKHYFDLGDDCFVFAEDVLGNQYYYTLGRRRKVIKILDVATGTTAFCANCFEDFAKLVFTGEFFCGMADIIRQASFFSGLSYSFFHHFVPQIPQCLGGDDEDYHAYEMIDSRVHLEIMGQLLLQIKDLPTGTKIVDVQIDRDSKTVRLVY